MRNLLALLAILLLGPLPAFAAPLHFIYEGAGTSGVANLPIYEALLGKPVDGATDFVDWTSTWPNAVASANWIAGSWQGKVANLSLSVPIAVKQNSGSPLHEVAAGHALIASIFTQNLLGAQIAGSKAPAFRAGFH